MIKQNYEYMTLLEYLTGNIAVGKTHTLTGSDCEKGIVQCTFDALFDAIAKSKDRNYMLRVSYVEIHDERVRDLLCHFAVTP
ncbi:hypothetical protein Q1695_010854 [Nippostrongylus brasiliensis]|nr:hypothetical protein Q1695_010854 [Nippostrongylus brasiliensis]